MTARAGKGEADRVMKKPRRVLRGVSVLDVALEVRKALRAGSPVVALETSVVAHGLPPPYGVEAALRCEKAVRAEGAVPATIGVVDGAVRIGMTESDVRGLAQGNGHVAKAGERDLSVLCATGASAGVTVSATCAVAARAGIRLVATGGIGGVHRTMGTGPDVSADLYTLARTPVAVVCAGAKAVLDIPATVEVLESLSVLVLGFGTSEFPNFYSAVSGIPVEHVVPSAAAAARALRIRFEEFHQGGALVVQRPPASRLGPEAIEGAVKSALERATRAGIKGKAVTPFLLAQVDRLTAGEARKVNVALLEANARLAARIAVEYARGG